MNEDFLKFTETDYKFALFDTTTYTLSFPSYRLLYLQKHETLITDLLSSVKIKYEFDYKEFTFLVSTTSETKDPITIIKARDVLNLLSRGMSFMKAKKVLKDKYVSEIINISKLCKNKKVFVNRRKRFEGEGENCLKALILITKTKIKVQGKTISVLGSYKNVKEVRKFVDDVFTKNIHPVYLIRTLIEKRKLEGDKGMEKVDWAKYLPEAKSKMENKRGDGKKKKNEKKKVDEVKENEKEKS